ncbi:integration host factor subunit beta [Agrobacterium tumefaciens]|uniref:integration host factor subunit beta n=1 Tax=Agrobacterium tumefaciens TaxID=358 RepID=UPI000DD0D5BB|nr:integration host factor subunit beta [Agrobacterium tumefaciens]
MIKSELIQIITARNPHLYHRDAEKVLAAVLDEIVGALEDGGRVELRGFGTFSVRHRPSRSGRNPRNGKSVFVEEKWVPFFKTSRDLQRRLNPADEEAQREPGKRITSRETG